MRIAEVCDAHFRIMQRMLLIWFVHPYCINDGKNRFIEEGDAEQ